MEILGLPDAEEAFNRCIVDSVVGALVVRVTVGLDLLSMQPNIGLRQIIHIGR